MIISKNFFFTNTPKILDNVLNFFKELITKTNFEETLYSFLRFFEHAAKKTFQIIQDFFSSISNNPLIKTMIKDSYNYCMNFAKKSIDFIVKYSKEYVKIVDDKKKMFHNFIRQIFK